MSPAEERLGLARRALETAEVNLANASTAVQNARAFLNAMDAEVQTHIERDKALAAERAVGLKRSLRSGSAPTLNSSPATAKERATRIEAENRQAAARKAAEDLSAEAQEAKVAADTARAELEAAARVLSEEADAYAAKVVALEREALSNRTQLESALRCSASGWGSTSAAKVMIEAERGEASARRGADGLSAEAPKASAALDEARSFAAKLVALELEALANRIKVEAAARSGTLGWEKQIALSQLASVCAREPQHFDRGEKFAGVGRLNQKLKGGGPGTLNSEWITPTS